MDGGGAPFAGNRKDGQAILRWSLDPWRDRQAVWLAADRDPHNVMKSTDRPMETRTGVVSKFEGEHMTAADPGRSLRRNPAAGPYGEQRPIQEIEGNFL
jgi:hypothetical protein